jgi:hypothetical protein
MADVFISYSQRDRATAKRLAAFLAARGIDVWWDTAIVGGESFRDAILRELEAARVAIVIWSTNSIGSRFVLDEADRAAATAKLLSVLDQDFQPRFIPMGFGSFQAVPLDDEDRIVKALEARGIMPRVQAQSAAAAPSVQPVVIADEATLEHTAWTFVKDRSDPRLLEEFLGKFQNGHYSFLARRRLLELRWDRLRSGDDIEALQAFVAEDPEGELAQPARARIAELEAAKATRLEEERCKAEADKAAERRAAAEASSAAETAAWETIKGTSDVAALKRFLDTFPDGANAAAARKRLDQLITDAKFVDEWWGRIRDSGNRRELLSFAKAHPHDPRAGEAKALMDILPPQRRSWKWIAGIAVVAIGAIAAIGQVVIEDQARSTRSQERAAEAAAEEERRLTEARCQEAQKQRTRFADFTLVMDSRLTSVSRENYEYPSHTTIEQDHADCAAQCRRRTWCRAFDPHSRCDLYASDIKSDADTSCRNYWFRRK